MKKNIFLALMGIMILMLCGSVAAAEMPDNNYVNLSVSNDNGARINVNGDDTYRFWNGDGTGGTNSLKINNVSGSTAAQVINTTAQSGTFYMLTTGGQGRVDNGILMLAVSGTIPDNFQVNITASGYNWTVTPGFTPSQGDLTYNPIALNETFNKSDFIYDSQIWKPYYQANYPIYEKQDMTNTGNTFHIMLIDLYSGLLVGANYDSLIDNGAIKIQYAFQNLPATSIAAFNAYGYQTTPESGQTTGSVQWTNRVNNATQSQSGPSGCYVYVDNTAPTVTSTDPANYAVNVDSNKVITVTFNEAIKFGNSNIKLRTSTGTIIPITKSISGNVLTITPTSALAEAKYFILIYAGSVADLAGNPVAAKSTSFSVGTSPTVTSTDPANYAMNVATNKVITVTFDKPILAKYLSLVQLKTTEGILIPTTKSVTGNVLTITPTSALAAGSRYLLMIYYFAVTDIYGNPNVNKAISFTTGST